METLKNWYYLGFEISPILVPPLIKGKKKWESVTPYLMKLHFLPVAYRIQFKIALLVFKCLNNIAPVYLNSLIKLRTPNVNSVRLDNDFFKLESILSINVKRCEGAFSYQAPKIWNELPYEIRSLSELSKFKSRLKSYYFNKAYLNNEIDGS